MYQAIRLNETCAFRPVGSFTETSDCAGQCNDAELNKNLCPNDAAEKACNNNIFQCCDHTNNNEYNKLNSVPQSLSVLRSTDNKGLQGFEAYAQYCEGEKCTTSDVGGPTNPEYACESTGKWCPNVQCGYMEWYDGSGYDVVNNDEDCLSRIQDLYNPKESFRFQDLCS